MSTLLRKISLCFLLSSLFVGFLGACSGMSKKSYCDLVVENEQPQVDVDNAKETKTPAKKKTK